ncbi:YrhB domain-containing protein [Streptomyces avermitilis]|uniref:YrhB domain-containing protein n=1 Tax=Streptomyces avermitilis TaxID=33903 RepID=UPI0034040DBF
MMERDEALQLAKAFLASSQRADEPPLAIDVERVREKNDLLIVPYNSVQYLASRDVSQQLLAHPGRPCSRRRAVRDPRRAAPVEKAHDLTRLWPSTDLLTRQPSAFSAPNKPSGHAH